MTQRKTMLEIAEGILRKRAEMDGDNPVEYDPEIDPEGYLVSILTALRHWCDEFGFHWKAELAKAQEFVNADHAEAFGDVTEQIGNKRWSDDRNPVFQENNHE